MLGFGILTVLAGIAVLAWPGVTLLVIAVLFGLQLVISGVFRFVLALTEPAQSGGHRALYAVLGLLSLIVGLWALRHADLTVLVLAVLLGIFWIVNGAVERAAHADIPMSPEMPMSPGMPAPTDMTAPAG